MPTGQPPHNYGNRRKSSSSPRDTPATTGFFKDPGSPAGIQPIRTKGTSVLTLQMSTSSQKLSRFVAGDLLIFWQSTGELG